jgi:hypothetical protein
MAEFEKIFADAASYPERMEKLKAKITPAQVSRLRQVCQEQIDSKVTAKTRFVFVIFPSSQSLLRWVEDAKLESWDCPTSIESISLDEAWERAPALRNSIATCRNTPGTFIICVGSVLPGEAFNRKFNIKGEPNDGIATYTCTVVKFDLY